MSIGVNGNVSAAYAGQTYKTQKAETAETADKNAELVEQLTEEVKKNEDSFVKSNTEPPVTYKPDQQKISEMKAEMHSQMGAFRVMVQSMLTQQGKQGAIAQGLSLKDFFENISVDAQTQADAQASIAEGGEWSVEAVSDRLLEFAKALSGGDPSKIETLRKAVQDGFKAAEGLWGGKLPEISQKTYDRTMAGFDEWAESAKAPAAEQA